MTMTLAELKKRVDKLAKIIGAPTNLLPTYGHSDHTARHHVEVDGAAYFYVIVERGETLKRETTLDLDELLFWIFAAVTAEMSNHFAAKNSPHNEDFRRAYFKHQLDLLAALSPAWAARRAIEQETILKQYPFDDLSRARADFAKKLRDEGMPADVASTKAGEKYPKP